jgi:regulator of sigma E protease
LLAEWFTGLFYSVVPFVAVLSLLIFVHEFGHFWVARRAGVRVEKFSIGFGKELFGWTRGDTRYSVSVIPFGGFVKMAGEQAEEGKGRYQKWEYMGQPIWKRMSIVAAGPAVNYVVGFLLLSLVFVVGNPKLPAVVGSLSEGYPAKAAGIHVGDRIVSIDGKAIHSFRDMQRTVIQKTSGIVEIVLDRKGREIVVEVEPRVEEGRDLFGREGQVAMIGVTPAKEPVLEKLPLGQAVSRGWEETWRFTTDTYRGLFYMVTGQVSFRKSVAGPVAIFVLTGETAKLGIHYLLHFMAVISIALGIFNFLPIPVLDGGHLLFLVLEKIKGRPVDLRWQERVQQVAITLLLTLMVVVSVNDVINFKIWEKLKVFFGAG